MWYDLTLHFNILILLDQRKREPNARLGVPFRHIHALMHPNAARGTVVPIPPKAPVNESMSRGTAVPRPVQQQQQQQQQAGFDFFANAPATESTSTEVGDLASLFGNAVVAPAANVSSAASTMTSNPFDAFVGTPVSRNLVPPQQQQQHQLPPFLDQRDRAHSSHSIHTTLPAGVPQQFQPAQYGAPPLNHAQSMPQITTGSYQGLPHGGGAPSLASQHHQQPAQYGMVPPPLQQQMGPPPAGYHSQQQTAQRSNANQQQVLQAGSPPVGYNPQGQQQATQRSNANPFDPFG